MIEVALVLSLLARHWTDSVIIGVLLAMNGLVAFSEEHQAANAIEALKQRLASTTRVRRDGEWMQLPVGDLVPGDVVRVRLGDIVPADAVRPEQRGQCCVVQRSMVDGWRPARSAPQPR